MQSGGLQYKKHILRGTQKEEMTSWMYIIKEAELDRKRSHAQMSERAHRNTSEIRTDHVCGGIFSTSRGKKPLNLNVT